MIHILAGTFSEQIELIDEVQKNLDTTCSTKMKIVMFFNLTLSSEGRRKTSWKGSSNMVYNPVLTQDEGSQIHSKLSLHNNIYI